MRARTTNLIALPDDANPPMARAHVRRRLRFAGYARDTSEAPKHDLTIQTHRRFARPVRNHWQGQDFAEEIGGIAVGLVARSNPPKAN